MDISAISTVSDLREYTRGTTQSTGTKNNNETFEALFQSAVNMINETNEYTKQAEEAEMSYALGLTTNTHELQIAQQKANISLQYTVAVRNAVMDAYKEIMQLQF
ncbi:MAG: flagellar hook-basal body complex protein FliE [Lachnospiraceae bacterium]|nr:flagellar hook-basal body complex protein FliE [Lachnospiraceae bacterium]